MYRGEHGLVGVLDGVAVGNDMAYLGAEGLPELVEAGEVGGIAGFQAQLEPGHPVDAVVQGQLQNTGQGDNAPGML